MQVRIKNLKVGMELGNEGVEFEIRNNQGKHLGDLRLGKATVEWCRGRTRKGGGKRIAIERLIDLIEKA